MCSTVFLSDDTLFWASNWSNNMLDIKAMPSQAVCNARTLTYACPDPEGANCLPISTVSSAVK